MITNLGDITNNFNKRRVPVSSKDRANRDKKYRYYGAQGIVGYIDDYIFDGEYLLVAEDGENLKSQNNNIATLVSGKFWVNNHAHILQANEKSNTRFLYYYLSALDTRPFITGSAQPKLTKENLASIPVALPEVQTQESISKTLSLLDEKVELNSKISERLEEMARVVYDYWFTQFDFPDENNRPYKTNGGEMIWSEKLKREIPKGWRVKNLMDICDWVSGAQPPKSTFKYRETSGYIRFIQNRDYADSNNLTFIPISKGNKVCDVFDIMMDKYGDAGQIRYGLEGAYNVALAKVKPRINGVHEYLRGFLGSESVKMYLFNACMASTRASLNGEILGNLFVVIPDTELLFQFEKLNKTIIQQLLVIKQESTYLAQLRDFLLPMLMNGQVTVS